MLCASEFLIGVRSHECSNRIEGFIHSICFEMQFLCLQKQPGLSFGNLHRKSP